MDSGSSRRHKVIAAAKGAPQQPGGLAITVRAVSGFDRIRDEIGGVLKAHGLIWLASASTRAVSSSFLLFEAVFDARVVQILIGVATQARW
jgi:hypothetical protein